ncbi:MAG: ABC transporter substrate-binding protein [Eubacteriales bacterium]|nr:ABC transporter substrate-binding protein [Eubacteriales bacterium]
MKKRWLAALMAGAMALSMTACGNSGSDTPAPDAQSDTGDDAAATAGSYNVGIVQLVQHPALDRATQGFQDKLTELVEQAGGTVKFDSQNASGESANCATIVNGFVSANVDLIMANATPALQAAQAATEDIPILGTSVTDYGTALGIEGWTSESTSGTNISGTTDLAPLDGQAQMLNELFPDANNVGLLFCSAEPNSRYQVETIKPFLEDMGYTCTEYSFTDSNDVAAVAQNAASACDVLYIPTDNTAASCTEAIANVVLPAKVPVIAGEQGICEGCGVASLSIDYYDLGTATGEMAFEILVNGADAGAMPVQPAPVFTKMYNAANCEALGLTMPADYVAIEG